MQQDPLFKSRSNSIPKQSEEGVKNPLANPLFVSQGSAFDRDANFSGLKRLQSTTHYEKAQFQFRLYRK